MSVSMRKNEEADNSFIVLYPRGLGVFGSIPASDFARIVDMAKAIGHTHLYTRIANYLRGPNMEKCTFALASCDEAALWIEEIELDLLRQYPDNKWMRWLRGTNTGLAAVTLFMALAPEGERLVDMWCPQRPAVPSGDYSMELCARFVIEFGLQDQLYRVVERFPEWKDFIDPLGDEIVKLQASGECET